MTACWRCGTKTPVDANFCPNCGAEARAQVRELDVFAEPAGVTEPVEAATSSSPRGLIIAAVVLLGGLIAFYALTGTDDEPSTDEPAADPSDSDSAGDVSSDEPGENTNASTATSSQPEVVGEIAWDTTFTAAGVPMAVIEVGASTFVYARQGSAGSEATPVRTFERDANGDWTALGNVGDDQVSINSIAPTPDGAIAVGLDADGEPTVWRSADGRSWAPEALPRFDDADLTDLAPAYVVAAGDAVIVVGSTPSPWLTANAAAEVVVNERFATAGAPVSVDLHSMDSIKVRGPFGIVIGELDPAEIGLDTAEDAFSGTPVVTSWWNDGDGWHAGAVESDWWLTNFVASGQRILRVASDSSGLDKVSEYLEDGGWSDVGQLSGGWGLTAWGDDRLVTGSAGQQLKVYGADLELLDAYPIPDHSFSSHINALSAGASGLLMQQQGEPLAPQESEPTSVVVLRDGYTLEVDQNNVQVRDGDETLMRWSRFWVGNEDRYTVDLDASPAEVTFIDLEGAPIVAFTLAELAEIETAVGLPFAPGEQELLFTSDGERWHTTDVERVFDGQPAWLTPHVLPDRLIAAAVDVNAFGEPSFTEPTFRILEAPIPD